MNEAVKDMLKAYKLEATGDYEHALREIFQEIALLGLWRGRFFEHAAFYGGTALRVLYGLERFSEDMDFTLIGKNERFDLSDACRYIERELDAWGFPVHVELRNKTANTAIESAFMKANTREQMLRIEAPDELREHIQNNRVLRIKVEVDTDPPAGFMTETRFLLQPIPFSVRTGTLPSLYAGKMHALLFRNWKNRVKGRDWYDWIWYVSRGVALDLNHLSERMRQTNDWSAERPVTPEELRLLLRARIDTLDISLALKDAEAFVKNRDSLSAWSKDLFIHVLDQMQFSL